MELLLFLLLVDGAVAVTARVDEVVTAGVSSCSAVNFVLGMPLEMGVAVAAIHIRRWFTKRVK